MTTCAFGKSVFVLSSVFIFNKISSSSAATECNLEKIFRTPKDVSKPNFDHFELVERNNFESSESQTATEQPFNSLEKPPVPNVAHAQVSLRFGGDTVRGKNNIMKIPPEFNKHYMDHYSHYHHPYPPPVPMMFPNYYYSRYGRDMDYTSEEARDYFRRYPTRRNRERPGWEEEGPLGERRPRKYYESDDRAFRVHPKPTRENEFYPEILAPRPKYLKQVHPINDFIERDVATAAQTKEINREAHNPKPFMEIHDTPMLLDKSLVSHGCKNCTGSSKMLVRYPIMNREDSEQVRFSMSPEHCPNCYRKTAREFDKYIDDSSHLSTENVKHECKCDKCQCKRSEVRKFPKDYDQLVEMIYAQIIDSLVADPKTNSEIRPKDSLGLTANTWKNILETNTSAKIEAGPEMDMRKSQGLEFNYSSPDSNVENPIRDHPLKYTQETIRDDASRNVCQKCGKEQEFCRNCGYPVMKCPHCGTCPKETRQLNEW